MKWKWLYSVSQCTCNISPWAIIVLPDTVTLISTSSLLSAVFPSAWPASANTVFESVCVHVCACVFTAYCPVCFQVCELASRHSVVWRRRPAIASAIEKEPHCRRDQSWDERNFTSWPSHKAKLLLKHRGHSVTCWVHPPGLCFHQSVFLWRIAHSQMCLLELAVKTKWRANMYVNWVGQNEIFGKRSVCVNV